MAKSLGAKFEGAWVTRACEIEWGFCNLTGEPVQSTMILVKRKELRWVIFYDPRRPEDGMSEKIIGSWGYRSGIKSLEEVLST